MKREFTCRECGAIFPAGTANCPKCGRELGLELQKKSPEGKQSATGFLAAILIGLLIGGLLYLAITAESEQRMPPREAPAAKQPRDGSEREGMDAHGGTGGTLNFTTFVSQFVDR